MNRSVSQFCLALIKVQEFCEKFSDPHDFLEEILNACQADGVYDWEPKLEFVSDVIKLRGSVVFSTMDLDTEILVYSTYLNLL